MATYGFASVCSAKNLFKNTIRCFLGPDNKVFFFHFTYFPLILQSIHAVAENQKEETDNR